MHIHRNSGRLLQVSLASDVVRTLHKLMHQLQLMKWSGETGDMESKVESICRRMKEVEEKRDAIADQLAIQFKEETYNKVLHEIHEFERGVTVRDSTSGEREV